MWVETKGKRDGDHKTAGQEEETLLLDKARATFRRFDRDVDGRLSFAEDTDIRHYISVLTSIMTQTESQVGLFVKHMYAALGNAPPEGLTTEGTVMRAVARNGISDKQLRFGQAVALLCSQPWYEELPTKVS